MTPQKAALDSMRTLSGFVFYQRLSPQFQFSLSATDLGMYFYAPLCLWQTTAFPTTVINPFIYIKK
jgi:hypothetical protein